MLVGEDLLYSPVVMEVFVRSNKLNEAILHCLEYVATSTSPPGVGAADFLIRLLDTDVFTCDEMDEITMRVGVILRGITERHSLSQSS